MGIKQKQQWISLIKENLLNNGEPKVIKGLTLFKIDNNYFACENRCPHMGYPMSKGTIRDSVITCAWHNWDFDMKNGGCLKGACKDLKTYPIKLIDGWVCVKKNSKDHLISTKMRVSLNNHLIESMTSGDAFTLAKGIAEWLDYGDEPKHIVRAAIQQSFKHAIAAHQSDQAVYELQSIMDAFILSDQMSKKECVLTLLQGISIASGHAGIRPEITPFPGKVSIAHRMQLIGRYTDDASQLAIERSLKFPQKFSDKAVKITLSNLSVSNQFIEMPQVLVCISAIYDAIEIMDFPLFEDSFPALTAWVLGRNKPTPSPTGKEAINWLNKNETRLMNCSTNCEGDIDIKLIEALCDETHIDHVFDKLIRYLEDGVSPLLLLNHFSFISAKKFNNLALNNGGLWNSASEGFRMVHSIRRLLDGSDDSFLIRSLFYLATSLFKNRWLKGGKEWSGKIKKSNLKDFEQYFSSGSEKKARDEAVNSILTDKKNISHTKIVSILMNENQSSMQLNTLRAAISEGRLLNHMDTFISGIITYASDMKQSQYKKSAADFGISYMKN